MIKFLYSSTILLMIYSACFSQSQIKPTIGAYYFDGWTGKTFHITKKLTDSFPERRPVWGWLTSTQKTVDKQIELASRSGIDFFSFCWYYSDLSKRNLPEPRNSALNFYLNSSKNANLKFNILVANHDGYLIGPENWDVVCKTWIKLFRNRQYLKSNDKPIIIFFDYKNLINTFGSVEKVKIAFNLLRKLAQSNGLVGVSIAACSDTSNKDTAQIISCGFDILTGYNYHQLSLKGNNNSTISKHIELESKLWSTLAISGLPYIPVVTLNWDRRPWDNSLNSPRLIGYSEKSVYDSITSLKHWINSHGNLMTNDKLVLIYAWNEYGEGAYLTPTDQTNSLLEAFKSSLTN